MQRFELEALVRLGPHCVVEVMSLVEALVEMSKLKFEQSLVDVAV